VAHVPVAHARYRSLLAIVGPMSIAPPGEAPRPAARQLAPSRHSRFELLLSELNPLQYIPIVGTLYRAITGDSVPAAARTAGGLVVSGLIGGPVGLATGLAALAFEKFTGVDPERVGRAMLADVGLGSAGTTPIEGASVQEKPPMPEIAEQDLGWTPDQLRASGVRQEADGSLTRGHLAGSDVLNTLELARLAPVASFQSFVA
jgi:hypothetical protein